MNFGSGGVGTTPHMAGELFAFNAGIKMVHVAYRGEAPGVNDLLGGQIPFMFSNLSVVAFLGRADGCSSAPGCADLADSSDRRACQSVERRFALARRSELSGQRLPATRTRCCTRPRSTRNASSRWTATRTGRGAPVGPRGRGPGSCSAHARPPPGRRPQP